MGEKGEWRVGGRCGEHGHVYPKDGRKCENCGYEISNEMYDPHVGERILSEEVTVKFEHRFNHGRKVFTMRHYSDGTWELLDENGLPVVQCSDDDEGVIDTTD